ncbi:MAG: PD-(D/E)XK nuclease-like domain-containing protein [Muribaculaceae bacterium]|nr:PD-(D/E)XK nuclease-like domain-containing protein [Muribaculaceae bacterium]
MHNPDTYYQRSEVSNSDLTALKEILYPRPQFGDREKAFRIGSIVDAMISEKERVDFLNMTLDGQPIDPEEFLFCRELQRALRAEARRDPFLENVLKYAQTQCVMVNEGQLFNNGGFEFSLNTRCKWDWWLPSAHFGGDLKTVSAQTEAEFRNAIDFFDWDRSRAWYMDIAGSNRDFIYAVSKKNFTVFKKFINRGDEIYNRGREKYEDLAFKYWCFAL